MEHIYRRLAPSEEIFVASEHYFAMTLLVRGPLRIEALDAAVTAMCAAAPMLAARIADVTDGYAYAAGGQRQQLFVTDGDPDAPLNAAELARHDLLFGVFVVRAGDRAAVSMQFHHSLADGPRGLSLLAQLWSLYGDATAGRALIPAPQPFPEPVETLLAERGVVKFGEPDPEPRETIRLDVDPEAKFVAPHLASAALTVAETDALLALAARQEVTLNGLVSAALLLAETELGGIPLHELLYVFMVDLRARLNPPLAPMDGSNIMGFAAYMPAADVAAELVPLARAVNEHLRVSLEYGVVQQTPLHSSNMPDSSALEMPNLVMCTNLGRIPDLTGTETLDVEDFVLLGSLSARGRRPTYQVRTFAGRLSVDWPHYDDTPEAAQHRVDTVIGTLRAAVESAPMSVGQ
ncbi:phthiocerol/phthiodiolone dimycocerosyl transferase family protein [Nocardia stercoris]|uniref:Phthiocerol/phthiodiolone dimycocerosyl transferase n=1 Tax=Nocardia stercoris TaxID=2483361 RepID=A0A3M2LA42_9NOCA|nr:wax ester/triacylglycerol synthase domain-containing protein [Nocardia stercoris]RMI33423.1 hypothetical protein EBN03_09750 [Nocardia stercoris]